jgi:aryl-alcohol dehydrogenase-like predicted oxidoreductase
VPIEDTVGALSELVEQGKVRALGLTLVPYSRLARSALTGRPKPSEHCGAARRTNSDGRPRRISAGPARTPDPGASWFDYLLKTDV